jgi:hypothetical protein
MMKGWQRMLKRHLIAGVAAAGLVSGAWAGLEPLPYVQTASFMQRDHDFDSAVGTPNVPAVQPKPLDRPFSHPVAALREINADGLKVFNQPGALPYVAIGIAALAADKQTEKWFNVAGAGEAKPKFSKIFNNFGDGKVLLPACAVLYVVGRGGERDTAKLWGVAMVNAAMYSQTVKMLTGKERPYQSPNSVTYHGPSTKYDSFPSGHMTVATASAVVLGHQYPKAKLAFYSLAACVGVARIRGADHWPSDVYWGAGAGFYGGWQAIRHKDDILQWRF